MIDASRWVLAEAWLSLGLRLDWIPSWRRDVPRDQWNDDEEEKTRYLYEGAGLWLVEYTDARTSFGYPRPRSPQMGLDTMRHELAHYLVSSDDARAKLNFGLGPDDRDAEEHALGAERVIDAIIQAGGRIAGLAMASQPPRVRTRKE